MPSNLPKDVLELICKKLDGRSLSQFDKTCTRIHNVVSGMRAKDPVWAVVVPQLRGAQQDFFEFKRVMAELHKEHTQLRLTVDSLDKFKADMGWKSAHKRLIDKTADDMRARRKRLKSMKDQLEVLWGQMEVIRGLVKKAEEQKKANIVAMFGAIVHSVERWHGELGASQKELEDIAKLFWAYTSVKV